MNTENIIEKEDWANISGLNNMYSVSNIGRIKRVDTNFIRTPIEDRDGYYRMTFSCNTVFHQGSIHRIVAEAFIPNPDKKPCVNHKNGIKKDNSVSNLEWCTNSENESHSYRNLGKINPGRKLTIEDIVIIKKEAIKGIPYKRVGNIQYIANRFKVSRTCILNVLKGRTYA